MTADLAAGRGQNHIARMHYGRTERRRYGRIQLDMPMPARFGERRVRVVELSLSGFRVAHERLTVKIDCATLAIDPSGKPIEFACAVTRCNLAHLATNVVYHSGLKIVSGEEIYAARLRETISERVMRAIREMEANAKGVEPLGSYLYQPAKGDLYRRCEFVNGRWRSIETNRTIQPMNGFTISAEVDGRHVDLLCRTWERGDADTRRLIRRFAEMSIDDHEGVAVRRYVP